MRFIIILGLLSLVVNHLYAFAFFGKCVTDGECKEDQFCDHTGINPIGKLKFHGYFKFKLLKYCKLQFKVRVQSVKIITVRVCLIDTVAASIVIILNASEKLLLKMENVHGISTKIVLHLSTAPTGKMINAQIESVLVLVEKVKVFLKKKSREFILDLISSLMIF
jgi:hypothetical protein